VGAFLHRCRRGVKGCTGGVTLSPSQPRGDRPSSVHALRRLGLRAFFCGLSLEYSSSAYIAIPERFAESQIPLAPRAPSIRGAVRAETIDHEGTTLPAARDMARCSSPYRVPRQKLTIRPNRVIVS
jgi:hypothetical protein